MAVSRSIDATALVLLVLAAFAGRGGGGRGAAGLVFLTAFLIGTAAGYRVAAAAFRWGRRRQGRDPEPSRGAARMLGGFIGFWLKLLVGFAFWALLLQFFQRVY